MQGCIVATGLKPFLTLQNAPPCAGQQGEGTPAPAMSARDAVLCRATAKDLEDGDPEGAKMRLEKYFKCAHQPLGGLLHFQ